MKALIVDDSRVMRRILGTCLKELQVEVVEADNGRTALDALASNSGISLMFLDWNMPVMTGIECLHELRQASQYDAIKVCMVTSESEQGNVVQALTEGANEYLMKPFTKEAVQEKLQMILGAA